MPRGIILPPADRAAGYYWELPDGEKQNRCPRVFIKEYPDNWQEYMLTYKAYEAGHLPVTGGLDDQPALFLPVMATISSAIQEETQYEQASKPDPIDGNAGAGTKGYAKITTP